MYLYHLKPENFVGTKLFPLSDLKKTEPAIYDKAVRKYEGREAMLKKRIPRLECLWNEAIHFSPISPKLLWDAYVEAGGVWKRPLTWLKIPIERVKSLPSTWYSSPPRSPNQRLEDFQIPLESCAIFEWDKYQEMIQVPETTKSHYREKLNEGKNPLMFVGIPHVLIRGAVESAGCIEESMQP